MCTLLESCVIVLIELIYVRTGILFYPGPAIKVDLIMSHENIPELLRANYIIYYVSFIYTMRFKGVNSFVIYESASCQFVQMNTAPVVWSWHASRI